MRSKGTLKVRLNGLPEVVEAMIVEMKENENYRVLSVSKVYEDRNSEYIRVYIEIEI
jgi:hypothetical protein